MLKVRIIPCLQLVNESLVKTVKFDNFQYIGDPINTVRIFNELEVDELTFLDIRATSENREPNLKILREIADECFMPLSYGGGIRDVKTAKEILSIGFEKVVVNNILFENQELVTKIAEETGSQSVIVSIDVRKNVLGKYHVYKYNGKIKTNYEPLEWAQELEKLGAGEILLTSINKDGTWDGFDVNLMKIITSSVHIPVIANGGAGNNFHIEEVVKKGNVSAVALGSMVVFQAKGMGVLVNFPDKKEIEKALN
jgi:cyclase